MNITILLNETLKPILVTRLFKKIIVIKINLITLIEVHI